MSYFMRCVAVVLCILLPTIGECAQRPGEAYAPQIGQDGKDVAWVPTALEHVDIMLDMAKVTSSDYVIDIGSGDGRLVIAAAKRGATALGIEYDPKLVELSRRAAAKEGVSARATFKKADIFVSSFSNATVITLFLLEDINIKLRPKILNMKPGTRIVSNTFRMGQWEPDKTDSSVLTHPVSKKTARINTYLWIVPAKVNGTWKTDHGQISFIQTFQNIRGTLTIGDENTELVGRLDGTKLTFSAQGIEYTGEVKRNMISGTHADGKPWKATR